MTDYFDVLLAKSLYFTPQPLQGGPEIDFAKIEAKLPPKKYAELVEHISEVAVKPETPNKIADLMGLHFRQEAKALNELLTYTRTMHEAQNNMRREMAYQRLANMGASASRCFYQLSASCSNNAKLQNLYQDIGSHLEIATNLGTAAISFASGNIIGGITASFNVIGSIASYRKLRKDRKNKKPHPMLEAMAKMVMQSTEQIIKYIHKSNSVLAKLVIDSIGMVLTEISEVYQSLGTQIKSSEIAICKDINKLRDQLNKIGLELSAQNERTHQENVRLETLMFTLFAEDKVQALKRAIFELNKLTSTPKKTTKSCVKPNVGCR